MVRCLERVGWVGWVGVEGGMTLACEEGGGEVSIGNRLQRKARRTNTAQPRHGLSYGHDKEEEEETLV